MISDGEKRMLHYLHEIERHLKYLAERESARQAAEQRPTEMRMADSSRPARSNVRAISDQG